MTKQEIIDSCELPYELRRSVACMRLWTFKTTPNRMAKKEAQSLEASGWQLLADSIPQGRKTVQIWRKKA